MVWLGVVWLALKDQRSAAAAAAVVRPFLSLFLYSPLTLTMNMLNAAPFCVASTLNPPGRNVFKIAELRERVSSVCASLSTRRPLRSSFSRRGQKYVSVNLKLLRFKNGIS